MSLCSGIVAAARGGRACPAGGGRAGRAGRSRYEANAAALRAALQALDADYRQVLQECRRKEFITAHAAFGYLARRYGLRVIAVSGLTPEAEPSASRGKEIAQQARRAGIRVVFVEPLGGRRVAGTIARGGGGAPGRG